MTEHGVGIKNPLFFIGVIENNVDPRKEGRVQVRAFGIHGTNQQIPTDALPWAIVAQGDWTTSSVPRINSWVFGVFLDGRDAQQPMVLSNIPTQYAEPINPEKNGWGVIPGRDGHILAHGSDPDSFGEPAQSKLMRGERTETTHVLQHEMGRVTDVKIGGNSERTWSEPGSAYKTQYPFNKTIETKFHSIEMDDTPGGERITVHHKSGSYVQIDARGTTTHKSVSDKYEVNNMNHHVSVGGMSTVTINGNSYVYVKGNKIEEVEGDYQQLIHGNHLLSVGGQANVIASEQVQIRAGDVKMEANVGTMAIKAAKELQTQSGLGTYFKSAKIWVQATDALSIKGKTTLFEGTESLDIFSDKVNIQGTSDFNIKGDAVLKVGSDGEISVSGSTVHIDDYVNMANGGSAPAGSAFPAEDAIDAASVGAPEPTAKSTSIVPDDDPASMASSGFSSPDQGQEPGTPSFTGGGGGGGATLGDVSAELQTAATPLLDFIGNKESDGYDDIWGGIPTSRYPSKPLSQMTIKEVLDWQESVDRFYRSEAVGRYQFLEDTLRGYNNDSSVGPGNPLYTRAGLSESDLFSPINQDKMAVVLLEGRGLSRFIDGTLTREQFANNLASEWASLPLVTGPNAGKSKYAGDGLNAALTSIQPFLDVLDEVKARNDSIISGGAG